MNSEIEDIRRRLEAHDTSELPATYDHFVDSAILAPLLTKDGKLHLLFTRRTQQVKHHKGQISFPGGRRDPEDKSPLDCALRETQEEIGVDPESVDVLGRLDRTPVISKYVITPFVGTIPYPFDFKLSETEAEELLILPVDGFLRPEAHKMHISDLVGHQYPIHFYEVEGETVWGATGRIMTQFLELAYDYRPPLYQEWIDKGHNIYDPT